MRLLASSWVSGSLVVAVVCALSAGTLQGASAARLQVSAAPIQVWDQAVDPAFLPAPEESPVIPEAPGATAPGTSPSPLAPGPEVETGGGGGTPTPEESSVDSPGGSSGELPGEPSGELPAPAPSAPDTPPAEDVGARVVEVLTADGPAGSPQG